MTSKYTHTIQALFLLSLSIATGSAQTPSQFHGPNNDPFGYNSADDEWHISLTPYLWLAGMHGTVGERGAEASVHASANDVFNYLNIGLMGDLEARKKRLILNADFMWIRLKDERALPINEFGITSVNARIRELILTPKIGFRVLDWDTFKLDATAGFRYWNLGQEFTFTPTIRSGVSNSSDWVDGVGGARLTLLATPKLSFIVAGDVGRGQADLDYQVGGFVAYNLAKWIDVTAGYRYLYVNYRKGDSIFNTVTDGVLIGARINFK